MVLEQNDKCFLPMLPEGLTELLYSFQWVAFVYNIVINKHIHIVIFSSLKLILHSQQQHGFSEESACHSELLVA